MIMADVFAVFGTLLAVGISLPGLLLTWHLLLPKFVDRAGQRLDLTPWRCFFVGTGLVLVSLLPLIILFNLPGFQALGFAGVFSLLTITSLGAAGLASLMGQRLHGLNVSPAGATIRGAVVMELAAAFPLVGWFVFIPLTFLITLGAAVFALLGWEPRAAPRSALQSAPTDDVLEPETSVPGIDVRQALHNR